jgi:lipopolysaccharide/colanic/teichoic acid biosynthesis glycosyltransferase
MLPIALAVRVDLGAPVLFRQQRPGLNGQAFELLKFRSMRQPRPGEDLLSSDGVRLTRLGRALRASSLDELPTLFNVLRGEMSLVGPRPLLMEYLPRYSPEQARRHEVKPGITGWTQVNGRNALSWEQKFALDLHYVEHQSLCLDLEILARTVLTVLRRQGISHGAHVTMPPFMSTQPSTQAADQR